MAACCAAGDGERLERVQPSGERRGLAEGGPAGTDEPQRSFSGPCFEFPSLLTFSVVSTVGYFQIKRMNTRNKEENLTALNRLLRAKNTFISFLTVCVCVCVSSMKKSR